MFRNKISTPYSITIIKISDCISIFGVSLKKIVLK
jgi:hypothetical protein